MAGPISRHLSIDCFLVYDLKSGSVRISIPRQLHVQHLHSVSWLLCCGRVCSPAAECSHLNKGSSDGYKCAFSNFLWCSLLSACILDGRIWGIMYFTPAQLLVCFHGVGYHLKRSQRSICLFCNNAWRKEFSVCERGFPTHVVPGQWNCKTETIVWLAKG